MIYILRYFQLRLNMAQHSFTHHTREIVRYSSFLLFFLFVSLFVFFFLYKAFKFFYSFEIVGEFLVIKLLSMIFFIFFIFLILSNINSIIKWFFTKNDLPFVLTNPVSMADVYFTRGMEVLFESSWAFIFFSIPVILAYYLATGRFDITFLFSCLLLIPFIIIPHGIAFIMVMVLGRILSPRVIKNTFSFLSLMLITLLVVTFRAIQIEKLARPESFAYIYEYMRFLSIPTHPLIPINPFIESIVYFTRGENPSFWLDMGLFLSTACSLSVISYWIHEYFYMACYTNIKSSSTRIKRDILARVFSVFPQRAKNFFLKEIKNLKRDPKEWSQVFLILALIFVYVYNFKLFPKDRSPLPTVFLESLLTFLNMGLLTFVISAICVRFVYTSFQLEGRPFWILLSSPVSMKELYIKKLMLYVPPILLLALILNYFSNKYIAPPGFLYYVSFGYSILIAFIAPVLSLFFGTKDVNFREPPNPYGGFGGIVSMLVMIAYAMITIAMLTWSSYWLLIFSIRGIIPPVHLTIRFTGSCVIIFIGTIIMIRFMVARTLENLKNIEL